MVIELDGVPDIQLDVESRLEEVQHWLSGVPLHHSKRSLVIVLRLGVVPVTELIVLQDLNELLLHVSEEGGLVLSAYGFAIHLVKHHSFHIECLRLRLPLLSESNCQRF